ncbi:retron St85 family RNA-directed DNA polymerase [Pseudomonas pseudonitroreducens]|uniref:retron St85 family RNA-directed DNA polymerase n=1 Tax=Pseudomonas pseudonitroreducens TaxID=2892326 RepID=UPI001F464CE6|nr:retron St85 family RNA-directed DNA polymerase [Pseudomonas pseudonitroreducens]
MTNSPLVNICADTLHISTSQVMRLILRAPHTYKVYSIPKKSGGRRIIAQPAKETKYLQDVIIKRYLNLLPIHEAASAYKIGSSIKNNANAHKHNKYFVKLDFKRFFESITLDDLVTHFEKYLPTPLSKEDTVYLARICCRSSDGRAALTIGSPASPVLSNTVMYDFDKIIESWSSQNGFTYTRYADDLTLSTSTPGASAQVIPAVLNALEKIEYPKLLLNNEKTVFLSRKNNRRITGIVINNDGRLSLGREKKRLISAMIYHYQQGRLSEENQFKLQGLIGFALDIEPIFVSRLNSKYGRDVISKILQRRQPKQ